MTKKEIVKTISEEIGVTQLKIKEIVQKTFDAIIESLATDGRIELRNFGVFEVKKRAPRQARNPLTGEKIDVPEKLVVSFKAGKEMEARVNELAERRETEIRAAENQATEIQNSDTSAQPTGFESQPPFDVNRANDRPN